MPCINIARPPPHPLTHIHTHTTAYPAHAHLSWPSSLLSDRHTSPPELVNLHGSSLILLPRLLIAHPHWPKMVRDMVGIVPLFVCLFVCLLACLLACVPAWFCSAVSHVCRPARDLDCAFALARSGLVAGLLCPGQANSLKLFMRTRGVRHASVRIHITHNDTHKHTQTHAFNAQEATPSGSEAEALGHLGGHAALTYLGRSECVTESTARAWEAVIQGDHVCAAMRVYIDSCVFSYALTHYACFHLSKPACRGLWLCVRYHVEGVHGVHGVHTLLSVRFCT
jgi:hypothetical protein